MSIQPGTGYRLGQYRIEDLLGSGSMGTVYRGYQLNLKREVAIKLLPAAFAAQKEYRERFTREAEIVARLEHAHIVPIYDFGVQDSLAYIVMRLLTGGTLYGRMEQVLVQEKRYPSFAEVCTVLDQLASALSYAHCLGIVHRDVKPSNVMFDNQGVAYLTDFGLAKLADSSQDLSASNAISGTPSYMAPEQWRSEAVGPATDQYALAVLAYTYLTGKLPFEAPTPYGLMYKHLSELPTPPHHVHEAIPRAISQVLQRALSKDPAHRFKTITDFAQAFERATSEQTQNLVALSRSDPAPLPNEATPLILPVPVINTLVVAPTQQLVKKSRRRPSRQLRIAVIGGFALLALVVLFVWARGDSGGSNSNLDGAAIQTGTTNPFAVLDLTGTATTTPTPTETVTETQTVTSTNTVTPSLAAQRARSSTPTLAVAGTRVRPPATQRPAPTSVPTSAPPVVLPSIPTSPPVHLPGSSSLPKLP